MARLAIERIATLRSPGDEFFKNVKFDEFRTTKKPIYELARHLRLDTVTFEDGATTTGAPD